MIGGRSFLAALLVTGAGAQAQTVSERDRFGDAMRIGLPLAAAGYSLWRQDFEGRVASGYLLARPLSGGSAMVIPQPGGIAFAYATRW